MQADFPLVSICVPAYKHTTYLERLLDSISIQTFKSYEVVVTDDSPEDTVKQFLEKYTRLTGIRYIRNRAALGTPENWNEGIRQSKGKWIKLMHDDDWFADPFALQAFFDASMQNPNCKFFFSAFQNVEQTSGNAEVIRCNAFDRWLLTFSPLHLFKRVYVGNPSCTFIRRDVDELYDNRFKFVVDFEYYIRLVRKEKNFQYIDKVLLNIGFNDEQVTRYTFLVAKVQVPENLLLLEKLSPRILRNVFVYDYYWRMFRNLKIRSMREVTAYYPSPLNPLLKQMLRWQKQVPSFLLFIGPVSKMIMLASYLRSWFTRAR